MEIGSSKIFKSKGLVFAHFSSFIILKLVNNYSNIEGTIFPSHICQKMGYLLAKKLKGVSDGLTQTTLKFGMQKDFVVLLKNPENSILVPGPLHCENGFDV